MPQNKIGYIGQNPDFNPLQGALSPSETWLLPAGQGVIGQFGALANNPTGATLSGQYLCSIGPYSSLQQYDPILQIWRNLHAYAGAPINISSDGTNYRIANLTGCPIGAVITNAGTGLTNGFNTVTVTPSAGGSVWNTLVGGAINTTVTVTAAGSNYTKPPILLFLPPLAQGSTPYILPTAVCTLSSGAINTVTVTNQGAGLVAAPTIVVIPQAGDTTGGGGVLTVNATLVGSGTLTWMGVASPGNTGTGLTAVPTFTFSPASTIAATCLMNFVVTGLTTTAAGVAYPTTTAFPEVISAAPSAATPIYTNPNYDKLFIMPRVAQVVATTVTTTFAGATIAIADAGFGFEAVPPALYPAYVGATTQAVLTPTVGGINDFFSIQPF
jgi:hypothetical protein